MAQTMREEKAVVQMVVMHCGECGIPFGVPDYFYNNQRALGPNGGWTCPNGHSRVFCKSEAEKVRENAEAEKQLLRKEIEDNKRWLAYSREKNNELVKDVNSERAKRGAATRKLNRVKNGVCPCCNRTFQNLLNHMNTKHPEYQEK